MFFRSSVYSFYTQAEGLSLQVAFEYPFNLFYIKTNITPWKPLHYRVPRNFIISNILRRWDIHDKGNRDLWIINLNVVIIELLFIRRNCEGKNWLANLYRVVEKFIRNYSIYYVFIFNPYILIDFAVRWKNFLFNLYSNFTQYHADLIFNLKEISNQWDRDIYIHNVHNMLLNLW